MINEFVFLLCVKEKVCLLSIGTKSSIQII
jgi:hypothetical protein